MDRDRGAWKNELVPWVLPTTQLSVSKVVGVLLSIFSVGASIADPATFFISTAAKKIVMFPICMHL